eukprot:gnl/Chilomastix_cuspidata/1756.p1 GENE.gnl/Chilomastix_cuspidata/1756~~gnl/Chilomastix_cuspidata/1756.p1  ORF type:complete len:1109 (+),score=225.22 gnl/Chilomastix_cuspidata/1756:833-4159(+)
MSRSESDPGSSSGAHEALPATEWEQHVALLSSLIETIWVSLDPDRAQESIFDEQPDVEDLPRVLASVNELLFADPTPQRLKFVLFENELNLFKALCALIRPSSLPGAYPLMNDAVRIISTRVLGHVFNLCSGAEVGAELRAAAAESFCELSQLATAQTLRYGGLTSLVALSTAQQPQVDECEQDDEIIIHHTYRANLRKTAWFSLQAIIKSSNIGASAVCVPNVIKKLSYAIIHDPDQEVRQWALFLLRSLLCKSPSRGERVSRMLTVCARADSEYAIDGDMAVVSAARMALSLDTSPQVRAEASAFLSQLLLAAEHSATTVTDETHSADTRDDILLGEGAFGPRPAPRKELLGTNRGFPLLSRLRETQQLDDVIIALADSRLTESLSSENFPTVFLRRIQHEGSRLALESELNLLSTITRVAGDRVADLVYHDPAEAELLAEADTSKMERFSNSEAGKQVDVLAYRRELSERITAFFTFLHSPLTVAKLFKLYCGNIIVTAAHAAKAIRLSLEKAPAPLLANRAPPALSDALYLSELLTVLNLGFEKAEQEQQLELDMLRDPMLNPTRTMAFEERENEIKQEVGAGAHRLDDPLHSKEEVWNAYAMRRFETVLILAIPAATSRAVRVALVERLKGLPLYTHMIASTAQNILCSADLKEIEDIELFERVRTEGAAPAPFMRPLNDGEMILRRILYTFSARLDESWKPDERAALPAQTVLTLIEDYLRLDHGALKAAAQKSACELSRRENWALAAAHEVASITRICNSPQDGGTAAQNSYDLLSVVADEDVKPLARQSNPFTCPFLAKLVAFDLLQASLAAVFATAQLESTRRSHRGRERRQVWDLETVVKEGPSPSKPYFGKSRRTTRLPPPSKRLKDSPSLARTANVLPAVTASGHRTLPWDKQILERELMATPKIYLPEADRLLQDELQDTLSVIQNGRRAPGRRRHAPNVQPRPSTSPVQRSPAKSATFPKSSTTRPAPTSPPKRNEVDEINAAALAALRCSSFDTSSPARRQKAVEKRLLKDAELLPDPSAGNSARPRAVLEGSPAYRPPRDPDARRNYDRVYSRNLLATAGHLARCGAKEKSPKPKHPLERIGLTRRPGLAKK